MINQYLDRVSVRDVDKQPMPQQDIELISRIINNAPTSTNTQQFSAIIVTDQKTKDFISQNNWGQKHIAESAAFILFVGDRTRVQHAIKGVEVGQDMLTHEFHRAVVDATIAATYAHDALVEMGYGVTFVGGIVGFGEALAKEVNLPETAHVVVGLSVGKATRLNGHKPKVNKVFINKYDVEKNEKELMDYDKYLQSYYQERGTKGDYLNATKAAYDATTVYGSAFVSGGKYINKVIKNYK